MTDREVETLLATTSRDGVPEVARARFRIGIARKREFAERQKYAAIQRQTARFVVLLLYWSSLQLFSRCHLAFKGNIQPLPRMSRGWRECASESVSSIARKLRARLVGDRSVRPFAVLSCYCSDLTLLTCFATPCSLTLFEPRVHLGELAVCDCCRNFWHQFRASFPVYKSLSKRQIYHRQTSRKVRY